MISVFSRFEKDCQALQKNAKMYRDAMRGAYVVSYFGIWKIYGVWLDMVLSQSRIAETVQIFYNAADRTSEGAMAGHAYKRSVDDLDSSFTRELVNSSLLIYPGTLRW